MPQPTIGDRVHYTLTEQDAAIIAVARDARGDHAHNRARAGEIYPATVVRVFHPSTSTANLQVHLDGTDAHWATSRTEGDGEGHWAWPPRV